MKVQLIDDNAIKFKKCGFLELSCSQETLKLNLIQRSCVVGREQIKTIFHEMEQVLAKYYKLKEVER